MRARQSLMDRVHQLRRGLALIAGYAVVAGAASVLLSLMAIPDGEMYGVSRALIGLLGIAAGLLTVSGRSFGVVDGWKALALWAALQVPVYADTKGGNLFRQVVDIPAAVTSSTTINGVVTEFSQVGVNLLGIGLLIALSRLRERWEIRRRARAKALALA